MRLSDIYYGSSIEFSRCRRGFVTAKFQVFAIICFRTLAFLAVIFILIVMSGVNFMLTLLKYNTGYL